MKRIITLACGLALVAVAAPAFAHVHLEKATPAAKSAGPSPAVIALDFGGKIEPKLSGLEVVGANGAKTALTALPPAKDGKRLAAKPAKPLAPGAYKVAWHIVSTDGHRMTGTYDFAVK